MHKQIRDFLNTGLLELYVLGLLDLSEAREVEDMIERYPKVREVCETLQGGMQKIARESGNAIGRI